MSRRRRQRPQGGGQKNGDRGPPSSVPRPTSAVVQGWRLWALRVALIFLGPTVFLGLLEGTLFVGGVGYPTSFFVQSEQRGVLTTNVHFGWHYQQETLTEPEPCLVPVDKPKGTIRVFILGESAAMGTPDPSFGFARILEVLLQSAFPNERFEVINAAMRGINSHVIVPIARECAGLAPDLFVIYMGNNELNGLYGPKTPVTCFGKHPALIPAFHCLKQTRTAQLLRRVLKANPEAARTRRKPPTAEFFREHCTALDDPERDYVYRNFRSNLERVCAYGSQAGAGVILATVAVNLRDCPPLGSLHRGDLTKPQQDEWERLYRKGMMSEAGGDTSEAISCYEQAAALDDHYAELHFRLARCQLLADQREAARRQFILAKDWDTLQFRADTRLNDIVREVATKFPGGGKIRLVETEAALAAGARCPDGIPGREFFYEHVHLRFDGDYEVAKTLLPAVIQSLQERGVTVPETPGPVPSREQCAKALAFTAWDEVNTAAAMAKLTAQPPFSGQLEHAARQAAAEKAVAAVMDGVDETFVRQVIQTYRQAIEARPQDWHLRYNLGAFLHQLERPQEAASYFDSVVQIFPHLASFRVLLGYALGKAGRVDQAIEQFHQALKRDRRCQEAREGLNWARTMQRRTGR